MQPQLIIDVLFLIVGLFTVMTCAKRGLFKSLFKIAKLVLALIAAREFAKPVAVFVGDRFLHDPIREFVFGKINGLYQSLAEGLNAEAIIAKFPSYLLSDSVKQSLMQSGATGEGLVTSATDSITSDIVSVFSSAIGYVGVFLVTLIVLSIVFAILGKLIKALPLLHFVDSVCGLILGVVLAVAILFVAGSVLKFFCGDQALYTESAVAKFFGDSKFLEYFHVFDLNGWLQKSFQIKQ